ncbi:MAG: secondary thiamine-phosphate synthase enzyme YjbQ [Ardenticatenaceae bacterium]|nr:secondary thiamine-phosphate synthase enzyme YjbQ [Ardenticatenaceae bacterium]HBY95337.1 secondary thiamine-phosphate synthase enzyme [Chloroflexota bacterium]
MYTTINLETPQGDSLTNITDQVRAAVRESGVETGVCFVIVPHTTAALTINSYLDPATARDIIADVRRLVPTRTDFHHIFDTPADAAGHIKATLVGNSEVVLIEGGDLVLGHSQGLLFYDFDGPRKRRVLVKVVAE